MYGTIYHQEECCVIKKGARVERVMVRASSISTVLCTQGEVSDDEDETEVIYRQVRLLSSILKILTHYPVRHSTIPPNMPPSPIPINLDLVPTKQSDPYRGNKE
jgi:hypothetical protein